MASDRTVQLKEDSAKEIPESSLPDVQLNLLSIADKQICEPDSKYSSSLAISDVRPASASTVSSSAPKTQACSEGVPLVSLAASLTSSLPPLSESSLNVPALPLPYLDVALQEADAVEQVMNFQAGKEKHICYTYPSPHECFLFSGCWTFEQGDL